MITDLSLDEFIGQIDLLSLLQKYSITIDILYQEKYVTLETITLDKIETQKILLEDFIYQVEFGSVQMPGKFVLEHILSWASAQADRALDKILDNILEKNWGKLEIDSAFNELEIKINNYIFTYFSNYYKSTEQFSALTSGTLFDPNIFKKYIRCKINKPV